MMPSTSKNLRIILVFLCGFLFFAGVFDFFPLGAQTVDELKQDINEKNQQIDKLSVEIKELDDQILKIGSQGKTLQNAIKTLDVSKNKLNKEINVTENRIGGTNLDIKKIGAEIDIKEKKIEYDLEAMASSIRKINEADSITVIESMLSQSSLSELWREVEMLERFQVAVKDNLIRLRAVKLDLQEKKTENEKKKAKLEALRAELSDKKKIVVNNVKEKNSLLAATKNQESNYQKMLNEKKILSEAFEQELNELESKLRIIIDPKSIPPAGKGVLSWPLDVIKITQYFGDTEFAKSGAYNGKGHNGVDFGVPRGTRVKAARGGVVENTGNTDIFPRCYSYGKWIVIKHDNGLSTIYGHLDLIKVSPGQKVAAGDTIGYSGSTGYSTGPHLHLSVLASQGLRIIKYDRGVYCRNAIIPVADYKAYLNPLIYL